SAANALTLNHPFVVLTSYYFFQKSVYRRDLLSSPTRRSSDLANRRAAAAKGMSPPGMPAGRPRTRPAPAMGRSPLRTAVHINVGAHVLQGAGPDALDPGQFIHALERTVGLAIGHDAGRQDGADAGHLLQGVHAGPVHVHPGHGPRRLFSRRSSPR